MLFYVDYQVAIRSLRTITLLPDAILRWIGSGTSATSYNELLGGETGEQFGVMFRNTGSAIPNQAKLQGDAKAKQMQGGDNGGGQQKAQPDGPDGNNNGSNNGAGPGGGI